MSIEPRQEEERDTGRLEALSDGVFAVAITLLVLDLQVPQSGHLVKELLKQWPNYLAYALSFITILIFWVNHHNLFRVIKRIDHNFLLLNGLVLLAITVIPFSTKLLAFYIERPDSKTAQAVYSGTILVGALLYNRLWAYASRANRLLAKNVDRKVVESISAAYALGPLAYVIAFALAFVSAAASLAVCIALSVYFALPSSIAQALPVVRRTGNRP